MFTVVALSGLVVIVFAIRPKVCKFKSCRGRWIFKGDKIAYHDFLRRGSKAGDPTSKILRNVKDPYSNKSDICRQNSRTLLSNFLLLCY
jgi:hypothetical protein